MIRFRMLAGWVRFALLGAGSGHEQAQAKASNHPKTSPHGVLLPIMTSAGQGRFFSNRRNPLEENLQNNTQWL